MPSAFPRRTVTTLSLLYALLGSALCALAVESDPRVDQLIEALSLPESDKAMADHPHYRPLRKIVVSLPPHIASVPDLRERFVRVAGEAEVVFAEGGMGQVLPAELVADADAIIGTCHRDTVMAAQELRWLHSFAVGVERCTGLPEEVLERLVVTNNQRLSGPNIAEHVIGLMLSLGRGLHLARDAQQEERWDRALMTRAPVREFDGATMLILGLGGIGTEVARRADGLGMRVLATRRSARTGPPFIDYVGLPTEVHELAGEADVIVNALPLTEETAGLLDSAFFAAVKPGALYINVGRGETTVTADLLAALESGHLAGAGLDVTDPEPLPREHPLWRIPNVIITPHVAGGSPQQFERSALIALENLRRYLAGKKLLNPVDLRAGY